MARCRAAQLHLVHHVQLHTDHAVDNEVSRGKLEGGEAEVPHQQAAAPRLQGSHQHAAVRRVVARLTDTLRDVKEITVLYIVNNNTDNTDNTDNIGN